MRKKKLETLNAVEFFESPVIEKAEEVFKEKKPSIFDLINSQQDTYTLFSMDPEKYDSAYSQVIVNKFYSLYEDSILHSNIMNTSVLSNSQHDNYYHNAIKKRKRFKKWPKKVPTLEKIEILKKYFKGSSIRDINDYASIMSDDEILKIKRIMNGD